MHTRSRQPITPGFTLTELLVVIVIIVTIAALSLLGFRRVRDMADKATSMRNISQLQLANAGFASDNNGVYVEKEVKGQNGGPRVSWWFQNEKYLQMLRGDFVVPSNARSETVPVSMLDPKAFRNGGEFHRSLAASYGMNQTGLPEASLAFTVASVTRPSESMAFATATDVTVEWGPRFSWFSRAPEKREGKTTNRGLAYRYGDKVLVVYFDGHVSELSRADLERFDQRGGGGSSFWRPNR